MPLNYSSTISPVHVALRTRPRRPKRRCVPAGAQASLRGKAGNSCSPPQTVSSVRHHRAHANSPAACNPVPRHRHRRLRSRAEPRYPPRVNQQSWLPSHLKQGPRFGPRVLLQVWCGRHLLGLARRSAAVGAPGARNSKREGRPVSMPTPLRSHRLACHADRTRCERGWDGVRLGPCCKAHGMGCGTSSIPGQGQ